MQGFQGRELAAFSPLAQETSKRQQNWAGNAFTANVCAAYILAAAVVIGAQYLASGLSRWTPNML